MTEGVVTLTKLTDRLAKAEVYQSLQFSIAETLIATTNMRDAMPRVLRSIGNGLNWDLGMFWIKSEVEPTCLEMVSAWQSPIVDVTRFIDISKKTKFCIGESLPGKVWASGTPVWMINFDEQNYVRSPIAKEDNLKAAIGVPVYADLEIVGVLEFFSHSVDESPDSDLLDVLVNIGYRIGQFIKRRQTERRLAEYEARYRVLVDSAHSAVVVADENGTVVEWSVAAEEMFGWKKSEALGRNLTMIIPERFRAAHLAGMDRIRTNDHTFGSRIIGKISDLYGLHKEGNEFPIVLALSTWNTSGKRFFGAIMKERV
jgi:PAS domain S-box-containing protein